MKKLKAFFSRCRAGWRVFIGVDEQATEAMIEASLQAGIADLREKYEAMYEIAVKDLRDKRDQHVAARDQQMSAAREYKTATEQLKILLNANLVELRTRSDLIRRKN